MRSALVVYKILLLRSPTPVENFITENFITEVVYKVTVIGHIFVVFNELRRHS